VRPTVIGGLLGLLLASCASPQPRNVGFGPSAPPSCDPATFQPTYLPWLRPGEVVPQPAESRDGPNVLLTWSAGDRPGWTQEPGASASLVTEFAASLEGSPGADFPVVPVRGTTGRVVWVGDPGVGDVMVVWKELPGACGSFSLHLLAQNLSEQKAVEEISKIVASLSAVGGSEGSPSPTQTLPPSVHVPPQNGLPQAVQERRAQIVTAAKHGDYRLLREILRPEVFLSDFGFGDDEPDPVGRWEQLGPKPLATMGVLLRMPYQVRRTNEGILYRWPRVDAETKSPSELTPQERELLLEAFTEDEIQAMFSSDAGYMGPAIGILENGTWWFFLSRSGP
jgi:hypothetical protein